MASTEAPLGAQQTNEDQRSAESETLDRWRSATQRFAAVVDSRVQKIAENETGAAEGKPIDGDKAIKQIASLILSAQRAMEMQDRYEERNQRRKSGPTEVEERALNRFERIIRAAGLPVGRYGEQPAGEDSK